MSKTRLSAADYKNALKCVHALLAAEDLDQFTDTAVAMMPQLLSADIVGYNEVDPARGRFVGKFNPASCMSPELFAVWPEVAGQNPLVAHVQKHITDLGCYKITDFVSQRDFRQTGVWHEVYRPLRAEYQLAMPLPPPPGGALAITFNRGGKDFTERDRKLLKLLQPLLVQAYGNAAAKGDLSARYKNLVESIESMDGGIALVGENGQILTQSARAAELFAEFAPDPMRHAGRLPTSVIRWLDQTDQARASLAPAPSALVLQYDSRHLTIKVITSVAGGASLLSLTEHSDDSPHSLRTLGLTRRESEVLWLLTQGASNKEIAAKLDLSARTVEKHIEHILQKLHVSSRTAACAVAMKACI